MRACEFEGHAPELFRTPATNWQGLQSATTSLGKDRGGDWATAKSGHRIELESVKTYE